MTETLIFEYLKSQFEQQNEFQTEEIWDNKTAKDIRIIKKKITKKNEEGMLGGNVSSIECQKKYDPTLKLFQ